MKLYSASRSISTNSVVHFGEPRLVVDGNGHFTLMVGDFHWSKYQQQIDKLNEGESFASVVETSTERPTWRITRLPDFVQGRIVFDEHAKEYVQMSNGKCVLAHSSSEAFKAEHVDGGCKYAPSEAIALRPSFNRRVGNAHQWAMNYTHRAVNPCNLRPVTADVELQLRAQFDHVLKGKGGRI